MSLDVYLIQPTLNRDSSGTGIFVRDKGQIKEITKKERDEKFPDQEPVIAEYEEDDDDVVYHANITHNLTKMAEEAGMYEALWRPYRLKTNQVFATYDEELVFEESCQVQAREIILILEQGIERLKVDPSHFSKFNTSNGWGTYEQFLPWVSKYLKACIEHPDAIIEVSR